MFAKTALFIKKGIKHTFFKKFNDNINLNKTFYKKGKSPKVAGTFCLDPGQLWGLITAIWLVQGQL